MQKIHSKSIEKMRSGNPSDHKDRLFGFDVEENEASIHIVGVGWDATSSYRRTSSLTPSRLIEPSQQLDFEQLHLANAYEYGIYYHNLDAELSALNLNAARMVERVRSEYLDDDEKNNLFQKINSISEKINDTVQKVSTDLLERDKFVGLLGGDHSSCLGLLKSINSIKKRPFSILHIDAHHDLRDRYEGLSFSHASIMHQVLNQCEQLKSLVSLGIRDFSFEEKSLADKDPRVKTFYDADIKKSLFSGQNFAQIVSEVISHLSNDVYISFDIDGLTPDCCPATGTPVMGGLSSDMVEYLLDQVALSQKKVIGFDLCEVATPQKGDWDLNVGARMLYKLCCVSAST